MTPFGQTLLFPSETEKENVSPDIIDDYLPFHSMISNTVRETRFETVFSILNRKFGESLKVVNTGSK